MSMRQLCSGLFFALLCVSSLQAKSKEQLEKITISSIEELLKIKKWDDLYVLLDAKEGDVWSAEDRDEITIKRSDDFVVDGGKYPPVIVGHSLVIKDSKKGSLRNLIFRPGSDGFEKGSVALELDNCKAIEVANCSFYQASKALVSVADSRDITLKNSIFAEPLDESFGLVVEGADANVDSCLFARCNRGSPALTSAGRKGQIKMESSVIVDYGDRGSGYVEANEKAGRMRMTLSRNLYLAGPASGDAVHIEKLDKKNRLKLSLSDNKDAEGYPVLPMLEDDESLEVSLHGDGEAVPELEKFLDNVGIKGGHSSDDERIKQYVRDQQFLGPLS